MLSVIIITKNEAGNILDCLASVAWADEIIVVDSGSEDRTVDICEQFGARVYVNQWPGYGKQKNFALDLVKGDWVLSIDADERVTPLLREEIASVIANPGAFVAWKIPRLSSFCGRYMRHSGWWPDYVVRLFARDQARFSDDIVHEQVHVKGQVGTLEGHFLHESIESFEDLLSKMNQYTSAGALMAYQKGKKGSLRKSISHGLWAFFRSYILRAGFLDGREGFILAVSTAESSYYRYLKLMFMQQ
jgi:glycosyltransferase involved in cell wall biosynthesis